MTIAIGVRGVSSLTPHACRLFFRLPPPEALRRSNQALRQRCEEMEGWQRRTREERDFLSSRFQEARALVERLAQENHSLQSLVNGPASSGSRCSSSQTEDPHGRPPRNGALDGAQVRSAVSPRDGTRALFFFFSIFF